MAEEVIWLKVPSRSRAEAQEALACVTSQLVQFKNKAGRTVVGFLDYAGQSSVKTPVVIIPPGYGQTKTDIVPLSYPLAKSGFSVLRYDHTDHVGESDGEIVSSSMESMREDLEGALGYVKSELRAPKLGVAAHSLAFRNVLRVASEDHRIDFLCSILGIVDIRRALDAIYAQDIVALTQLGVRWGITDLLGFKVDADRFLGSAIKQSLHTLEGAIQDAQKLTRPVLFIVGEKDVLTKREAIDDIFHMVSTSQKEMRVLPNTMHIFYENMESRREVAETVVRGALKYLAGRDVDGAKIDLCEREVAERIEWERDRFRALRSIDKQSEIAFWTEYLKDFKRVVNLPDYWNLQEMIHDLLGEISPGERILDAGCGTGNFGSFLIVKYIYRVMQSAVYKKRLPLFHYVGVDFVHDALSEAYKTQETLQKDFSDRVGLLRKHSLVSCNFFRLDLAVPLCFQNGSFDKICCNLVLSYVPNDVFALSEMWRVLKPGGRMVITSLKPHADLTEVYRAFLKMADTNKEIEDARCLLANAGMIKAREVEGLYNFYSDKELESMLLELGSTRIHVVSAFSNQVYVGLAEKTG